MAEWWKTAKPGDRVVCIESFPDCDDLNAFPQVGEVYTIRDVICFEDVGFRFEEIVNTPQTHLEGLIEAGFLAEKFHPVQRHNRSTETGMQILREIASRKRQTVDAPNLEDA